MKTEIRTDPKFKSFYRVGLIFLFLLITILLISQFYNTPISGIILPDFFMGLLTGLAVVAFVMGFFSPRLPIIILDENGISTKQNYWNQSVKWDRLKELSLQSNKISVTYKQTGTSDTIRIPWLLRMKIGEIDEVLTHFSSLHDLEYYSERTLPSEEKGHVV